MHKLTFKDNFYMIFMNFNNIGKKRLLFISTLENKTRTIRYIKI